MKPTPEFRSLMLARKDQLLQRAEEAIALEIECLNWKAREHEE